ncbi:MAG: hypothetical protein KJP00_08385 [Bacteroidia bacterium]|nr:hypothetical protein [Bacteroidia bacterium]
MYVCFPDRLPGTYDGQKLRLRGKGQSGIGGGPAGDLFIILEVQADPRFNRVGDNLTINQNIDLYTAVLGGKMDIPTLTGKVKVTIPKATQNGKVLRLKGKGMPKYGKPGQFGELLVKINIKTPSGLSGEEERLFRRLQSLRQGKRASVNN